MLYGIKVINPGIDAAESFRIKTGEVAI